MEEEQGPQRVRLFVGGLGPSITPEELQRAFGSLGVVSQIEFIRSKARDFAYIDFEAPSPAALRKAFSTYQGCKWKGGCLRVERAKEDYLSRFKREWELDAAARNKVAQRPTPETKPLSNLKIFNPRSRKLKTIPASGTGRHKRSFQRFGSNPLALCSLCSCEEHQNEDVDPFNLEHESYSRLIDKLEDKRRFSGSKAVKNQRAPVSSPRRTPQSGEQVEAKPREEDRSNGVELHDNLDDESEEASEAEGVAVPGLRKRKLKMKDSGNEWDKIYEAAAGFKDGEESIEVDASQETRNSQETRKKRVRFVENGEEKTPASSKRVEEPNSLEPEKDEAGKINEASPEMKKDEKEEKVVEHQKSEWVQFSSWKALVSGGNSFSLARSFGAQPAGGAGKIAAAVAPVVDRNASESKKLKKVSSSGGESQGEELKTNAPSGHLLGKESCSFMRSSNAEAEWLSSKRKLRSDYRAKLSRYSR